MAPSSDGIDLSAAMARIDQLLYQLTQARGNVAEQYLLAGRLFREVTDVREALRLVNDRQVYSR